MCFGKFRRNALIGKRVRPDNNAVIDSGYKRKGEHTQKVSFRRQAAIHLIPDEDESEDGSRAQQMTLGMDPCLRRDDEYAEITSQRRTASEG